MNRNQYRIFSEGAITLRHFAGFHYWTSSLFPALAYFTVSGQAGASEKLLPLWPWVLLLVISNGFMEELLYRGLFLQKCEHFFGKGLSNFLTALVFTIMHTQVTYEPQMIQFLGIAFVLSLIWGFLTQKSDSLWGAGTVSCLW